MTSKTSITTISSSSAKEAPITADYLNKLLEDKFAESESSASIDTKEINTYILADLQKKSSKHKFIVQSTKLNAPTSVESELSIHSNFGAVWDSDKDGYISLKIENEKVAASQEPTEEKEIDADADVEEAEDVEKKQPKVEEAKNLSVNTTLISVFWIFVN
ncbi:uncharacterized protein RJT20DRAFT_123694 [Scheffersomyces xylosifermentans]|uniref:uncharacterized protein n=1 Tax=Scheffersomyces xylosifermentans TaxID=1304137 RepID=UPI00315C584A